MNELNTYYKLLELVNDNNFFAVKEELKKSIYELELLSTKGKSSVNEKKLVEKYLKRTEKNNPRMRGVHIYNDITFVVNGFSLIQISENFNLESSNNNLNFDNLVDPVIQNNNKLTLDKQKINELIILCKTAKKTKEEYILLNNHQVFNTTLMLEALEFYQCVDELELYIPDTIREPMGIIGNNKKSIILPISYNDDVSIIKTKFEFF